MQFPENKSSLVMQSTLLKAKIRMNRLTLSVFIWQKKKHVLFSDISQSANDYDPQRQVT